MPAFENYYKRFEMFNVIKGYNNRDILMIRDIVINSLRVLKPFTPYGVWTDAEPKLANPWEVVVVVSHLFIKINYSFNPIIGYRHKLQLSIQKIKSDFSSTSALLA